jgi:predicted secreted protein
MRDTGAAPPYLPLMRWTSALAIYLLFWWFCLFLVLPWHVRTAEEVGEKVAPGHAESAPHQFRAGRVAMWTTGVSALLFALYYLNYVNGWITADAIDWRR